MNKSNLNFDGPNLVPPTLYNVNTFSPNNLEAIEPWMESDNVPCDEPPIRCETLLQKYAKKYFIVIN